MSESRSDSKNISVDMPSVSIFLKYRRILIVIAHIGVFAFSLFISLILVNNMRIDRNLISTRFPQLFLFFILIKLPIFGIFKQFRGWWRYVGISDLTSIMRASLVSTFLIVAIWFTANRNTSISLQFSALADILESVIILDMFFTILLLSGLRLLIRLYYEEFRTIDSGRLKRFLIVGAGNAGEALVREISRMSVAQYDVVGFIDDDPAKRGMRIHGLPVLGNVEQLPEVCLSHGIEEIAIATPSATHQELRRVIQVCEGTKVRFRTVPSITDIASGKFRVSQIRDIDINDLLGREAVQLDLETIENFLKNKVILVTGAGGSIGSEMCRQVCNFGPKQLLLVELAENPLFHIENELNKDFPNVAKKAMICNITDQVRVDGMFAEYRPEVVIHAAAHKHVPLMETNAGESIKNNVVGTRTIADAADKYGSTNFVMISTDKAVNPTSLMGSSKRIAEMYIQDMNRTSKTHFVTVRFGNVLGSNGSVVPIFKKQVEQGGPVTVTHPEMQRYFMTIPEASQLVLQAATMGKGGEIFVLDMGEPVKIVDLAKELITLSGFKPGEDIDIVFTGLRPGEKLFEELSIEGEDMILTRHPKIGIWKNKVMEREQLHKGIGLLTELAHTQDRIKIIAQVKELIPEYMGDRHVAPDITEKFSPANRRV